MEKTNQRGGSSESELLLGLGVGEAAAGLEVSEWDLSRGETARRNDILRLYGHTNLLFNGPNRVDFQHNSDSLLNLVFAGLAI